MTAIYGYSNLYVPLDNSEHSDAAAGLAIELASAWGSRCVGMHAYAARMHDFRFKQMEYTLPEEYQDEAELLRQRRIHDSLITTGLELISDSYTDVMRYRCLERGVEFEARRRDGRNWEEIVADVAEVKPDLVVMGALGTGAVRESSLGSVAERVLRRIRTDVLLVRDLDWQREGDIVVAVDGSPQSFAGLRAAIELGRRFHRQVEAVAVYDPYLHYAVFNGIVDVLSEKASKVFRFKEQEALHEEIIDTGLAKIYESHLRVAQATAREAGMELPITLLDGKAFDRLLRHCRERKPWLLVMGRIGIHSDAAMDLGSATEQLIRSAPCNLLVVSGTYLPPLDLRADASVVWTPEAEERMERVPAGVRGLARTAVLRWATERGHSVVASGDVDEALDELMPFQKTDAGHRRGAVLAGGRGAGDGGGAARRRDPGHLPGLRLRGSGGAPLPVPGLRCRGGGVRGAGRRRPSRGGRPGGRRSGDRLRRAQAGLDPRGPPAASAAPRRLPPAPGQGDGGEAGAHPPAPGHHRRGGRALRAPGAGGARRGRGTAPSPARRRGAHRSPRLAAPLALECGGGGAAGPASPPDSSAISPPSRSNVWRSPCTPRRSRSSTPRPGSPRRAPGCESGWTTRRLRVPAPAARWAPPRVARPRGWRPVARRMLDPRPRRITTTPSGGRTGWGRRVRGPTTTTASTR